MIRRTFDPNVPVQPKSGTNLQLGEYEPADGSGAQRVSGYLLSDSIMVFNVAPDKESASPMSYTWTFGQSPQRDPVK